MNIREDIVDCCRRISAKPTILMSAEARAALGWAAQAIADQRARLAAEPTDEMMIAGMQEMPFGGSSPAIARRVYLAMRAAAPKEEEIPF